MSDDEGAKIIPFPRPPLPPEHSVLMFNDDYPGGKLVSSCSEMVHIFAAPEGRCQCGERLWGETDEGSDDVVTYDFRTPPEAS